MSGWRGVNESLWQGRASCRPIHSHAATSFPPLKSQGLALRPPDNALPSPRRLHTNPLPSLPRQVPASIVQAAIDQSPEPVDFSRTATNQTAASAACPHDGNPGAYTAQEVS